MKKRKGRKRKIVATESPVTTNGSCNDIAIATKAEFARRWSVSPRCVTNWIRKGLPHVALSCRLVRIHVSEADDWLSRKYGRTRHGNLPRKEAA